MAQPVVRFLACAGMVAAGLLMGGGIASADSGFGGLGGLGIGGEKHNDNRPRNDADRMPVNPPIVRIGAREDRGGFEVGPGGIRISRQPGFRGGMDISPDGTRHTIDERGISGAFSHGPSGSRVTFGLGPGGSGGSGASRKQGEQADAELSPSGTRVESEAEVAASAQGSSEELGASEGRAEDPGIGRAAVAQRLTIYIPVPRLLTGTGARARSPFATVVISVSTGSILRVFGQSQPRPEPTPSPSFRTGEVPAEVPNVEDIDSSGEGGSDYAQAGDAQPVRAPLVIAPPVAPPRPVVPPGAPPVIPPVAVAPPAGGRPGSQVHVPNSIVAGAPPRMRGSAPSPAPPPATAAVPAEVPATRLGYQRYLRTAKVTDMAVVAVPGVVGLMLITVSGTVIGHRQARAAHMLRHTGTARFMA